MAKKKEDKERSNKKEKKVAEKVVVSPLNEEDAEDRDEDEEGSDGDEEIKQMAEQTLKKLFEKSSVKSNSGLSTLSERLRAAGRTQPAQLKQTSGVVIEQGWKNGKQLSIRLGLPFYSKSS